MSAKVVIVDLAKATKEEKDALLELALSMYEGESCRLCEEEITSDEIRYAKLAGYHAGGRTMHGPCWDALSEDEKARKRAEWETGQ